MLAEGEKKRKKYTEEEQRKKKEFISKLIFFFEAKRRKKKKLFQAKWCTKKYLFSIIKRKHIVVSLSFYYPPLETKTKPNPESL